MSANDVTTRFLYIVRHAEAAQDEHNDFARPLTPYGETCAHALGERLFAQHYLPDIILTSPATRAFTTAKILADALQKTDALSTDVRIYNAELHTLQQIVQHLEPHYRHVMLVGHNPNISALASELSAQKLPHLSPCGLYLFQLTIPDWQTIAWHRGILVSL